MRRRLGQAHLTIAAGPGGAVRAFEAMEHVLSNWLQANKSSDEGIMGAVPQDVIATVRQAEAQAPSNGAPVGPGVVDVFTLILAYFVLIKSLNKKT